MGMILPGIESKIALSEVSRHQVTHLEGRRMLDKIDHVGIAVDSIDDKMRLYRDVLGLEYDGTGIVEAQGVKVAFFRLGESHLELLEPVDEESPVADFLDEHGEGIHHLAAGCEEIDEAREAARKGGLKLLSDEPLEGARDKLVSFVHPKDTGGVLLEFCQRQTD
jgi:methylmalonyl-CoA/ethylmalonyl-CoA epimerase